jgi:ABC-type Na+ efflux pump permease subunit
MLPGPVFFHELRTVARRRRSYALRTALGLFLLYLMIQSTNRWDTYAYQSETNREYTPGELALIGMNLFGSVIWLQGIVILLLTPAFVAGTIAEDRQRKVLSYLLASPLSGAEIVLGKLAARMVNLVVLVAVGLPVVSIALFLGGIDPADVWLWYGSSFSTLYLLAGVSIFVSTFSPRPRDAILRTYLIELVWLLLPLVEWLCGSAGGTLGRLTSEARPITEWVIGSSPIVLLCQSSVWLSGSGSGVVQAVTWLIGLQLLQGTLLLAWSTMRLRPVEQGSRLRGLRWLGSRRVSQPRRLFARRPCGDAPMIWKECSGTVSSPSLMRTVCLVCLTVAAVGGMGYWVYRMGIPAFQEVLDYGYGSTGTQAARDALSAGVRFLTACLYVLMALLLGAGAATGITMEREKDAWTSLTVTPLEGQEILTGKILGALWRVRGMLAALLFVWLIGLICGAVHPLGFLLAIAATSIDLTFIAVLGTYLSLRSKSSARAIAATIAILVFLNGGYLFCCTPAMNGAESILFTAGVTPMIVTAAPFSFSDLEWFLRDPPHAYAPSPTTFVMTGVLSLAFYGVSAYALLHACLSRFETEVDRPRRGFSDNPDSVSREGIVFEEQEQDKPDQDGILFVEQAGDEEGRQQSPQNDSSSGPHPDLTH